MTHRKKRVLLIDDEGELVEVMNYRLQTVDLDVQHSLSPKEGIEKAKTFQPDVILLDVMMPEIDGWEACRRIRREPSLTNVYIIILTSIKDAEEKIKEVKADHYMLKPFDFNKLVDHILDAPFRT